MTGVVTLCAVWFGLMNGLAFLAFRADKARAKAGAWRLSEATLLVLSFLGGWPAAKLAQRRFRHKTRKEPFRSLLNLTVLGPPLIGFLAFTAWSDPQVAALFDRLTDSAEGVTIRRGGEVFAD